MQGKLPGMVTIDLGKPDHIVGYLMTNIFILRQQIEEARKNKKDSIKLQLIVPKSSKLFISNIIANDNGQGTLYPTQNDAKKSNFQKRVELQVQGKVTYEMSAKTLYPQHAGYVLYGNKIAPNIAQALKVNIDGKTYVSAGVQYPNGLPQTNYLTYWIGLLIAESMRFSILTVIKDFQDQTHKINIASFQTLVKFIFDNFKTNNGTINRWDTNWEQEQVTLYYQNAKVGKGVVKKLIKKM